MQRLLERKFLICLKQVEIFVKLLRKVACVNERSNELREIAVFIDKFVIDQAQ